MVQTRAKKAAKGKGIAEGSSSTNRNGDGGDKSGNRKRKQKHTNHLDSINDNNAPKKMSSYASGYGYFNDDKINVKLPTGKIICINVKDSDTFGSIKLKIQADEDIPFDQQELVHNKDVLLNKDTLSNLYTKKGDVLTLMNKSNGLIKIFVTDLCMTYSIRVKPDVTIADVMYMTVGCDPDEVALTFNETVLEGSATLAGSNVIDGSTLEVLNRTSGGMKIKVNMHTGKTITLPVGATDTIEDVKSYISDDQDIHPDEQVLIFNNVVLADLGSTLFDFGINRNSTLTLMHRPFEFRTSRQIFIKTLSGEIITQEVKLSDTIANIKAKIEGKVNVPVDEQELIFNEIVLSDIAIVADFDINEESTLTLMHKPRGFGRLLKIFIKTLTGETITEEVKISDTVGDLKAKIQDKVDVHWDEQELIFNEMVLSNVDTLADFNINKESTLTLMRISSGLMRIFVKVDGRETITLDIRPSNTIADVKSKIFDMGKISKDMKDLGVLIFNGKFLEDGAILADYNIPKQSTVRLSVALDYRIRKEYKANLGSDGVMK